MASKIKWYGDKVQKQVLRTRRKALKQSGAIVARKAKTICPIDAEEKFAPEGGPAWKGRVPGTLKKSIRYKIVKKGAKVQVIAGNYYAFYASMVELGTVKMAARPYLRPALESSFSEIEAAFADKMPN